MNTKIERLVEECKRQEESCLYTSVSFFIWLRCVRWLNRAFIVAPIICGGLASWKILQQESVVLPAIFALGAGLLPAIYKAMDFTGSVKSIAMLAGEFKNLQDRFRQAGQVYALGDEDAFVKQFESLMRKLEDARKWSITPPEWCFKLAQRKIKSGDYDFAVDQKK